MKKLMLKLTTCMLILVMLCQTTTVYAATAVNTYCYKVIGVPNASLTTNLGAMCINGNTGYCIKTGNDDFSAIIYKITNINQYNSTSPSKLIKIKEYSGAELCHANGLTYYNGYLYVTPMYSDECIAPEVIKLNPSTGAIVKRYYNLKWTENSKRGTAAITYFCDGKFIVSEGTRTNSSGYKERRYTVVTLDNFNDDPNDDFGVINYGASFYVPVQTYYDKGFDVAQDITFSQSDFYGDFFIPLYNSDTKRSIVLQVTIGTSIVKDKVYPVKYKLNVNSPSGTGIEVESIDFDQDGFMYYCANFGSVSDNKDGIFDLSYDW